MTEQAPEQPSEQKPSPARPEQPPQVWQGGHPPYPPYPNYPYPPYPMSPPINMYAILALVFGVMVFPPLGIYFGRKAKAQIARSGERGVELANAGLVVGLIFSIIYVVFMAIWCGFATTVVSGGMQE